MENATKALGMAAGVLIAVMVIALIYTLIGEISETQKEDELQLKAEQTAQFNKSYESYEKSLLRGTEVISVANKVIDNNRRYEGDEYYEIHINITLIKEISETEENGTVVKIAPGTYNESSDEYNIIINNNNKKSITEFKQRYFKCEEIGYNSDARVSYLNFVELNRAEGL